MKCEFAFKLIDILRPFFIIEEVLIRSAASIEEGDTTPVCEGIRSILLYRTAR
jgi:hypothetical protein